MSHSTASLAKASRKQAAETHCILPACFVEALPKLMLCGRIRFSYPTGSSLQRMVNEDA